MVYQLPPGSMLAGRWGQLMELGSKLGRSDGGMQASQPDREAFPDLQLPAPECEYFRRRGQLLQSLVHDV